jgi:hypothetical protein
VLGQHPASPYGCGGSDGDTGDRMTAAGRNSIPGTFVIILMAALAQLHWQIPQPAHPLVEHIAG